MKQTDFHRMLESISNVQPTATPFMDMARRHNQHCEQGHQLLKPHIKRLRVGEHWGWSCTSQLDGRIRVGAGLDPLTAWKFWSRYPVFESA
jgi:hypothetical protein